MDGTWTQKLRRTRENGETFIIKSLYIRKGDNKVK